MDLLDKFDAVVIENDSRISPLDQEYCETQQKAYDSARLMLQELKIVWETMLDSPEGTAQGHFRFRYPVSDRKR